MEENIKEILQKLCKSTSLEIICTYETGKGDGYMGIVKMYQVQNTQSGEISYYVVKLSPLADQIHKALPVREIFLTEIKFYKTIARTMLDFQQQHQATCFKGFVDFYYSDETPRSEMLIVQNLTPDGYAVLNRVHPMQHDHMLLAFKEYARFHALSFAIKHLNPEMYNELTNQLHANIMALLFKRMEFNNFIKRAALRCLPLVENTEYYDSYAKFIEVINEMFEKTYIADEFSVILHGDSWCNNILYKHDASNKPVDVKLIDFQLSKVLSPAIDLSYLFYGCCASESLPNYKSYLRCYHETLADSLELFGLHVADVYPFTKLMEHWKDYGKFGFIMSHLMRIIMLSTSNESPDLSQAAEKERDIMMAFYYKMEREKEYNEIMTAIIQHFIKEKLIY